MKKLHFIRSTLRSVYWIDYYANFVASVLLSVGLLVRLSLVHQNSNKHILPIIFFEHFTSIDIDVALGR